ncbi:hypothetical protein GGQ64_001125 [Rhizobium azooxidifex]|uniref:Porin n=1 Tax=Mycoplana azooxidifex TaxID=1636188 RepID=A0A7W6D376_9HYPH|nr:porin [Mycoplana azooxidifex]MBB3975938.1 hypothetical protein [Mycoplana azooxidifex]
MEFKGFLLCTGAALAAVSGAHAADAIVAAEPEPMEYVRVCDAFGEGYFYIPGTETCLKLGGYVRFDVEGGDVNPQNTYPGGGGDSWFTRTRFTLRISTAADTEYGALKTYSEAEINRDDNTGSSINMENMYIELAGFRLGFSDTLYTEFMGDAGATINDWYDVDYGDFGRNQIRYTYESATGLSLAVSVEDDSDNEPTVDGDDNYMPDVVGGIGYEAEVFQARFVGAYVDETESGALKLRLDGTFGPVSVFAMGGWNTDGDERNVYTNWDGDWALWVGGTYELTDKAAINISANFDEGGDAEGALNIAYKVVPGFTITPELNYRNDMDEKDGPEAKNWGGVVRFQRNF